MEKEEVVHVQSEGEKKIREKKAGLLISKKKLIINIAILLVVTGLAIYTLVASGTVTWESLAQLGNLRWYSFLIILGSIAVYVFGESLVIFLRFRKINPKMSYGDCVGTYLYANIGTNITPAKAGHHPFRIYYLERKGNTFAQALANATQCQIVYTFVQILLYGAMAIGCAVLDLKVVVFGQTVSLALIGLIGIGLAIFASLVFIAMAFIPPLRKLIVRILAWFNVKMKKVQTKQEYIQAQEEKMKVLREEIVNMFTHFWETIPSILIYSIVMIFNNCLPYIVYCCLALHPFDIGELCYSFALYQAISYVSNIVPIPGNAGGAEALFISLYPSLFGDYTGSVVFVWRLASYYLLLIIEMIYFISSSVAFDTKKEIKLHKILNETKKGWTPEVHSHFDTMEMELLSVNFKDTQCYNCCHLQNNLFKCDKYQDKPDDIIKNKIRCPFYEERDNGEDL